MHKITGIHMMGHWEGSGVMTEAVSHFHMDDMVALPMAMASASVCGASALLMAHPPVTVRMSS